MTGGGGGEVSLYEVVSNLYLNLYQRWKWS